MRRYNQLRILLNDPITTLHPFLNIMSGNNSLGNNMASTFICSVFFGVLVGVVEVEFFRSSDIHHNVEEQELAGSQ